MCNLEEFIIHMRRVYLGVDFDCVYTSGASSYCMQRFHNKNDLLPYTHALIWAQSSPRALTVRSRIWFKDDVCYFVCMCAFISSLYMNGVAAYGNSPQNRNIYIFDIPACACPCTPSNQRQPLPKSIVWKSYFVS